MTIQDNLRKLGYRLPDDDYYASVHTWLEWYRGQRTKAHKYTVYNGQATITKYRKRMYMAKQVCEDWANLLMTENVVINTESEWNDRLHDILERNNFQARSNQLIEIAFGSGSGAFVEYYGKDGIDIDYVRGGMIFPLKWENGEVINCAFGSTMVVDGEEMQYIQIHELDGTYKIRNLMYTEDGQQRQLPEGLEEKIDTGSSIPLFQLIKPNLVNNLYMDNPLGIAVFANAMDILETCDLIYDSYYTEFVLGRKRLFVPVSALQLTGVDGMPLAFDPNDLVYQAVPDETVNHIQEFNGDLRAAEHELALNRNLSLLSAKCGLGYNRYFFDGTAPRTATEVISTKSDTYSSKCKHELILRHALEGMVKALAYLDGVEAGEITVEFDDAIITDRQADFAEYQTLVAMGIMRPEELRAWYFGEDIDTAKERLPETTSLLE